VLILAAGAVLAASVFLLPPLLVPMRMPAGIPLVERLRLENDRLGLRNEARTTLVQGFGGAFFVVTAFLTWRQIQVNREGQITDRFTRAIDQLGNGEKLDVRLGGIYALERIARASEEDRGPIIEILTAYVRGHASRRGVEGVIIPVDKPPPEDPFTLVELPSLSVRAPDVQAVMTVLGRRIVAGNDGEALQLAGVDLRKAALASADLRNARLAAADLAGANLQRVDLRGADLRAVELEGANLQEAKMTTASLREASLVAADLRSADCKGTDFERANLRAVVLGGAILDGACLQEANLGEAILEDASLDGAVLKEANLWKATLDHADLRAADLAGSSLVQASLKHAALDGANLTRAILVGVNLSGVTLTGAILDGAQLTSATTDGTTVWPEGFDWKAAGVTTQGQ
jgi:uncharacterized protein YjbI with pentapeptide repeats